MSSAPVQSILVPLIDELSFAAVEYAKMLSKAYGKPVSILSFNKALDKELSKLGVYYSSTTEKLNAGLASAIEEQDSVMLVWPCAHSRRRILQQLKACRELRIPYFFIPNGSQVLPPKKVALPMSFLIEDREKASWGRSLQRQFSSQFTILKPKDKGTRAVKNVRYVEDFFLKNTISFTTIQGRKSSFRNDKEALGLLAHQSDLMIVTASREYGLDDQFFGPKELAIIHKCPIPLMLLNPRGDLYILCGD